MVTTLWQDILTLISHSVDATRFETWFRPIVPLESPDNSTLVLGVQNKFIQEFLEKHYKDFVLSFAKKLHKQITSVHFVISQINPASSINKSSTGELKEKSSFNNEKKSTPKIIERHTPLFNEQYTFDLFITGSGNEFAKSVCLAVSENPGRTKFNPLLIYSGSGLGKTHLLHAIGNNIVSNKTNYSVIFITSEEFYFNFIDAIKNSKTEIFTERFKNADILMVDDIQFIAGKERTQEEFFYIFNTLYQNNKQIVLTSDVPPNNIQGLHDRLVSRFQWGLCVDIQPPDLETRVAILKKKAERDNLSIPENVLYFIAEHVTTNIRKLEGVIIRLLAFSSITNSDITIDLVKTIVGESAIKDKPRVSIDTIIDKVSEYYNIPVNNIREKNRSKEVAHCRQVAMYIVKTYTSNSLKSIGLHFGGRDHSTVIHAVKHIENNIQKDKTLANDITYIVSKLEL